jgi:hypothetical protein
MDLLGMLRKLGDRLGIIELASDPHQPSAPVKIQTRTITLDELMAVHLKNVRELAEQPDELPASFDQIFKAAGIQTPASGWTIDRLGEFLSSERIQTLDHAAAQREALQKLADEKVDAAEVIKDAVLRDQALDAFADFTVKKRARWLAEKQAEIQALKNKQKELEQQISAQEKKWSDWRGLKRQRERDMARAVGYLIDQQVISIDEE